MAQIKGGTQMTDNMEAREDVVRLGNKLGNENMERIPEWVIVNRPGWIPDRKGPFYKANHIEDMLRGLYELYPNCTCTVVQMPFTSYPQSGREWLSEYELGKSAKLDLCETSHDNC